MFGSGGRAFRVSSDRAKKGLDVRDDVARPHAAVASHLERSLMEKAIRLQNQEEEKALLGRFDRVLRSLRDQFGVRAISRGGMLRISGSDESVENAFITLNR